MRFLLSLLLVLWTGQALAQTTSYPSQLNPRNTTTVSTSNTAAVKTLTGVANRAWRIDGVSAFCSAGTSTITIAEAGTTTFVTNTGAVGTSILGIAFTPATYTAAAGATVVITLGTCGSGNTGTLNVQAEIH
jgi:hypothetical protein